MSASPMHLRRVFILRHYVDPHKAWLSAELNRPVNPRSPSLNSHSPSFSAINSKCLVSKYATRKSPFKLWFLSPPPRFFFLILHVATTYWGDLVICFFLLFVFPFVFRAGEDGGGWKWTCSSSTNAGQVEVSPASDSAPGTEPLGQEPA